MMQIAAILFFIVSNVFHPFHVSINEISFNSKENNLEITKKIFTDDLELALKNNGTAIFITENDNQKLKLAIENYLKDKFKIFINDKSERLIFLGYEIEEDAVWCYFQVEKIKNIKNASILDITLLETYPDQVNLVHFNYKKDHKSFKLDQNNPQKRINF